MTEKENVSQPEIREQIKAAVEKRREALQQKVVKSNGNLQVDSSLIFDCLNCNAMGDGILYAVLHNDKYIYNKMASEWMTWAGHYWEYDIMDSALGDVDQVAEAYLAELTTLSERVLWAQQKKESDLVKRYENKIDQVYKRASRLRSKTGRDSCLLFSHTNVAKSLAASGRELDTDPWLLACANGVIDLRQGELRDGQPADLVTKASPVQWTGLDEPAPAWEQFLNEIFMGDKELIAYIQRLFGYACTGQTVEHILPILWGENGRNGKGTLIDNIQNVMGTYAAPIQAEMLLDQGRARSSSGPSPDIMALRGMRMAFASETDEHRRFSTARVKWLSGGDILVGRGLQEKYETRFRPSHTLFLMTNNLPHAPESDSAFWERVHLIPFRVSFVRRQLQGPLERPADIYMGEKLKVEVSGILAWLVRGCLQWQALGLDPPDEVIEASKEARRNEDFIADFVERCCITGAGEQCGSTEIYAVFKRWWKSEVNTQGKGLIKHKAFGQMLSKKFDKSKSGTVTYFGLAPLVNLDLGE